MPIDDRDWYKQRQKKMLGKIPDESDESSAVDKIKQAVYNPKEFRSGESKDISKEKTSLLKILLVVTLLLLTIFAVVDYLGKGFTWQFIEREGKFRHLDKRPDDQRKLDAQVADWKENKGTEISICQNKGYANEEDVSQFLKKVDLFLEKVAAEKKRYQSEGVDFVEAQSSLENLSRNGNDLIRFYNKELVKCYANQMSADLVSKQAKAINISIIDLSKQFKKMAVEK